MTNNSDIAQIEVTMEQTKKVIAKKACLTRLRKNKDFKELIEEGYFKDESSRLVLLKADHTMLEEDSQKEINNQIIGIGYMFAYLRAIHVMGGNAERALEADEATLEELHAEEQLNNSGE